MMDGEGRRGGIKKVRFSRQGEVVRNVKKRVHVLYGRPVSNIENSIEQFW